MVISVGSGISSMATCPLCHTTYPLWDSHVCPKSDWTYVPLDTSAKLKPIELPSINWKEYTPARPPESGDYLVVYKSLQTGESDAMQSAFNPDKYLWIDVEEALGQLVIVTHYAKIELP